MKKRGFVVLAIVVLGAGAIYFLRCGGSPIAKPHVQGDPLDSLDGVVVYCNGGFSGNAGRNVVDGYNIGLKYQCVEFVKRYYFEHYHHRMPNSYGHAKDLFDTAIADGALNPARGLVQFTNGSASCPKAGDLLVLGGWRGNPYGHVAIISRVAADEVELVQQNTHSTRATYDLDRDDDRWRIDSERVLGWLRLPVPSGN
ncbi:MAG TPA: CHAP domain-containing protein [Flavobacteriales bacterium]|jgi:hypothetical protein|nr:CHAP domain-containing protein [Flavobacteriales bacterium]